MEQLDPQRCLEVLEGGTVAHLAVISEGEPYVTPMSYVMLDGDFVFRTAPGRRIEALRQSPRVCVEVSRDKEGGGWESVVFWGDAVFSEGPYAEADAIAALLAKYHSDSAMGFSGPQPVPDLRPVVRVTPENLTGRASGEGFSMKTRPGRL